MPPRKACEQWHDRTDDGVNHDRHGRRDQLLGLVGR
jgi:hypothetical protein